MATLARLLFPVPDIRRSPATLLGWWERRRPAYNAIVGATGVVTLATLQVLSWLPPHMEFHPPIQFVVVYALCANLCYSLGFAVELLLQQLWGDEVAPVGPTLFRHGLVFSVGLTLFPIGMAWLAWLHAATVHLLR
jgi:protein-S-isoprenylcysteine O-methyltransferase Ste14